LNNYSNINKHLQTIYALQTNACTGYNDIVAMRIYN